MEDKEKVVVVVDKACERWAVEKLHTEGNSLDSRLKARPC